MKNLNKILILGLLVITGSFNSCETLELEQTANPNVLTPDLADANLLFNTIQTQYRNGVTTFNNNGGALSRIEYFFGRNYFNNVGSGTLNGPWGDLYSDIIPDIEAIAALNSPDTDFSYLLGASKAMQAHLMMLMVDYLGDIPYSQVNNPSEFPSPMLDDDADVYAAAQDLLDEARSLMTGASLGGATDLYYGGSADKWVKFINTLQMRADLTTGNYTGVINASNVIESMSDDMEFKYGTNELQPDNRHPDYINDYRSDGANTYASNWLMDLMVGPIDFDAQTIDEIIPLSDPRRRYYFYRQNGVTPGALVIVYDVEADEYLFFSGSPNGETLQCSLQSVPSHLEFTPDEDIWCSVKLGYWGRFHGNDEGTPPDNFTRTASGVYPAGGRFDAARDFWILDEDGFSNDFTTAAVGLGLGAGGAGIEPIILSSFVEFWRAEAYLATGDLDNASASFEEGIRESIAKVMTFGPLDSSADLSLAPTEEDVEEFVSAWVDAFEDAPLTSSEDSFGFPTVKAKWDILGEQFFVAMYGGAADAYNFIRRTGYPRTISRSIEANPGPFPRVFFYPTNEVSTNPNVNQRQDLTTLVFWDSGISNPAN